MRAQFNPFSKVSGRYGAPMGRTSANMANLQDVKALCARHQGGGGGYDSGGAYWGLPCDVWGVWTKVGGNIECVYVRAGSRGLALAAVNG